MIGFFFNNYDCTMTQTIDITFARNYLLNPGGKVVISMQGYIQGGDPDYASLTLTLLECILGSQKYTLGGNQLTSSSWNTYNWGMRLPPNICKLGVQLYLRNHDANNAKPYAQIVSVILRGTPATQSGALPTTETATNEESPTSTYSVTPVSTQTATLALDATPTQTLSPEQSSTAATVSLSQSTELSESGNTEFSETATSTTSSSRDVTKSLSLTSSTTRTATETFGLVTLSQRSTRTQSANDSSSTLSHTSQLSPSLDTSPSASPISCSRLDKVSLVYDPTMMVVPADGNTMTTATISDHNTFEIIAASADRRIILTSSVINASFDFGDHIHWTIVQANVVSDESLVNALSLLVTSNTAASNSVVISLSSSNVNGSSDFTPWIPHGLSIYGSTTVELQLQLQCSVIDAVRNPFAKPRNYTNALASVSKRSGCTLGSVAGVGAASGSARLASITIAQCGADNSGASGLLPISFAVPSNCNFTSPHLDDINAIAGNWVVVLVGTAAAGIACAAVCLVGLPFVDAAVNVAAVRVADMGRRRVFFWCGCDPSRCRAPSQRR